MESEDVSCLLKNIYTEEEADDCKSQRWWVASRKQHFLDTKGWCTYEFIDTMTVCA